MIEKLNCGVKPGEGVARGWGMSGQVLPVSAKERFQHVCEFVCSVPREPSNIQDYFQKCVHLYTAEWLMKPISYRGHRECLSLNLHLVLPAEDTLPVVYENTLYTLT